MKRDAKATAVVQGRSCVALSHYLINNYVQKINHTLQALSGKST